MTLPVLLLDMPLHRLYAVDNLVINLWLATPTAEAYNDIEPAVIDWAKHYSVGVVLCNLFPAHVMLHQRPAPDVQQRIAQFAARAEGKVHGIAQVVLETGILAAAVCAVLSTFMFVIRRTVPIKMCNSVDRAAAWIHTVMPRRDGSPVWSVARIEKALQDIVATAPTMPSAKPTSPTAATHSRESSSSTARS